MPDKKENKIKIAKSYYTDIALTERKITKDEFERRHKWGDREKWDEMKYIALNPFLLHSFLLNLNVQQRLRAVKDMYGYSYGDIRKIGHFGGSVHKIFTDENEDRNLSVLRAKLAIVLDIPIVFILLDKPTSKERKDYNYMEYHEYAKKIITLLELKNLLNRPVYREILAFKMKISEGHPFYEKMGNVNLNCRIDLRKTFFSIEFHLFSYLDVDLYSINKIVEKFDNKISQVVITNPLLRDTFKLSLIGSFTKVQQEDAKNFTEYLINGNNGKVLYPYDFNFEKVVPN